MEITTEKLMQLSQIYGNAFYLLDSDQFEKNYEELSKAFSDIYPHFNIAYSYKTNYIPALCQIVNRHQGYAEVVSDMEMELALRAGVLPKKIIWNGPVKSIQKVKQLLLTGGTVNVDSFGEMVSVVKIADEFPEHTMNVGIRCNFDIGDGVVSRFGFDVETEEFYEAVNLVKNTKNMHLINLQCHFAKRNIEFWKSRAEGMMKIVKQVSTQIGYVADRIDLGGGLYGKMEEDLKQQFSNGIPEYADYAKEAAGVIWKNFPDAKPELLIEPGSALVGDCMKFVGRVESIKEVRGRHFATILGSQKNISMSGVNPPMRVYEAGEGKKYENLDVVGYTCIEGDVMYRNYQGNIAVGDFLVFSNCGSYSIVMKPPFIMPNFPILDICGGKVKVIKRGETFDDLFHTFTF